MATFIDTPPDRIEQSHYGQWLFTFVGGKDSNKLPFGAVFTVVYSPSGYDGKWHATHFKVVPGERKVPAYAVVKQRELTPEEIAHFKRLIADRGGE